MVLSDFQVQIEWALLLEREFILLRFTISNIAILHWKNSLDSWNLCFDVWCAHKSLKQQPRWSWQHTTLQLISMSINTRKQWYTNSSSFPIPQNYWVRIFPTSRAFSNRLWPPANKNYNKKRNIKILNRRMFVIFRALTKVTSLIILQ